MLFQSTLLKGLGWAILNSFWQFALLWLVYVLFTSCFLPKKTNAKHNLAYGLQCLGTVWFLLSCYNSMLGDPPLVKNIDALTVLTPVNNGPLLFIFQNYLPIFAMVYLVMLSYMLIQFFRYCHFSQQLTTSGLQKMDSHYRLFVDAARQQFHIVKKVGIYISTKIDTPLVVGFIKPIILIPVSCITQLSPLQMEAILLHELHHIKRNDYLLNLLLAFTEMILFFNPFSKLLIDVIKKEREHSCDDMVLQLNYTAHQYATALLTIETLRQGKFYAGIASNGNNKQLLLKRVQRMMHLPVKKEFQMKSLLLWLPVYMIMGFSFLKINFQQEREKITNHTPLSRFAVGMPLQIPVTGYEHVAVLLPSKKQTAIATHKQVPTNNITTATSNTKKNWFPILVSADEETATNNTNWQMNSEKEIAFTIPDLSATINANEAITYTEYPYIPNTSFEYYLQQDTADSKEKTALYNEHKAGVDKTKAKLTLENIDWNALKTENHLSTAQINQLKATLDKAIASADFRIQERASIVREKKQQFINQLKAAADIRIQEESIYLQQQELLQLYHQQVEKNKLQQLQDEERMIEQKQPRTKRAKILKVVEI